MAEGRNYLLSGGERLTSSVIIRGGAPNKQAPYTVYEAKQRLTPMLQTTAQSFRRLPEAACPRGQVVGAVTLNPEYTAKSYFPTELLDQVGLRAVGSRPRRITAEKRSRGREPEPALTTELFVAGDREAFERWARSLPEWEEGDRASESLVALETVSAPEAREKLKGDLPKGQSAMLEVVLHADGLDGEAATLEEFGEYLTGLGLHTDFEHRFFVGGLGFVAVEAPVAQMEDIATFAMVRAIRKMPGLRVLRPTIRATTLPTQTLTLPSGPPVDTQTVAAIFDGGVPQGHPISTYVDVIDAPGIGPAVPELLEHGLHVTSAFLFGHIDPLEPMARPYCRVHHYRVLDDAPGQKDHELYETLGRIEAVLKTTRYPLINISLGPALSCEDDEVHPWTAVLDHHLAGGETLATVAVGNTGAEMGEAGRIQVPADCVNALAVGACDTPDGNWGRAPYSSIGPGRSPGLVKPDLVGFGGAIQRPFLVVSPSPSLSLHPTGGTSFAAPSVLRAGAGLRAHFGAGLDMLAVRALVVHGCEASDHPVAEVGRGRVARSLEVLAVCADDEVRVVYQGEIGPGKFVRAPVPMPLGALEGLVTLTATLCFTSPIDPHHPGNYTQAGLEAIFRPHDDRRKVDEQVHANTVSFFGPARQGLTEEELRRDAWKWENIHHAARRLRGSGLSNPAFDLHYNAREEGHALGGKTPLRYALIVTLKAPRMPDLYDRVRRRYATQLEPLMPLVEIPIRT
ncbi:MAG: S8 family peptidase [Phenylobacterium sp.]|uniref:S8 family peptidase n=1 Tax=Phenylobacterium sp. TaxID=1871053 RepID=UPI001A315296|nr:S8 family peptidase [Phenylobacterium sp.]MBJ7410404.1 S8 family peptidase [Phenylobacterium sp.]